MSGPLRFSPSMGSLPHFPSVDPVGTLPDADSSVVNSKLKRGFTMNYYEAAKKVQEHKDIEKCLEVIRQATAELERRISKQADDR